VHHPDAGRCLTVPQVAEELATSEIQVVSMLRRGDIRAKERTYAPDGDFHDAASLVIETLSRRRG
jgi:hypothetical protein